MKRQNNIEIRLMSFQENNKKIKKIDKNKCKKCKNNQIYVKLKSNN